MTTTLTDLRRLWTDDTRAKLRLQGCPQADIERLTSIHMSTVTDEALAAAWRQAGWDIAAKKAAEAAKVNAQYTADLATQRATRVHQDRLAAAHRATEAERSRAEEAEEEVRELNRAMDDNSH